MKIWNIKKWNMNECIMNENQLTIVKENEFFEPDIHKIDSIIANCIRNCHNKFFQTIGYRCVYDIQLPNIGNKEIINLAIFAKKMKLYGWNKKLFIQNFEHQCVRDNFSE